MHTYEVHSYEVYPHEIHVHKVYAHETRAYEIHTLEMHVRKALKCMIACGWYQKVAVQVYTRTSSAVVIKTMGPSRSGVRR